MLRPFLAFAALLVALQSGSAAAQSPPGSAGAKTAAKCQQTIAKVNAKFVSQRLKRLAACSNAVLGCVQVQPGIEACVRKATAKCDKQLGPAADDASFAKLEAAVVKACATLPLADLLNGLGFADAAAACAAVNVTPIATAADVAACLSRLHASLAEEAYGVELPRAAELTGRGGISALVVPDLPVVGGCGSCGTPPPSVGKTVAGCGAAIGKAGATFLAKARAGLDKCAAALVACAQTKPDAGCFAKAKATCGKVPADLAKSRASVLAGLEKKCGGTLAFATLDAPAGINLGALACECQQVGVAPVASLADYALCLTRQHECRLAELASSVVPSFDGLLADQGLSVTDLVCPPPDAAATFAKSGTRSPRAFFGAISKFVKKVVPGSLRPSAAPFATRGTARRVGRPSFGGCFAAPGRSCTFRFPITKRPASLQRTRADVTTPTLVIGVQRADGVLAEDHFEVDLGDTSVDQEVEVELTYADDLAACDFDLALAVQEDGEVSTYTTVEQTPHAVPANDECGAARVIPPEGLTEVLDLTAATSSPGEAASSCAPGGVSRSVWYQFTAPANGFFTADTFGSDFDSVLTVSTGLCGETGLLGCVDDSDGTKQSKIGRAATQGSTYLIHVAENGDPGPTITLHFAFHFEQAGEPPRATKIGAKLLALNSTALCGEPRTAFEIAVDFDDADGDVLPGTTGVNVHAEFEPSGNVSVFSLPPSFVTVTGDGFHGRASFVVCTRFSADTRVVTGVALTDLAGAGNSVTVKIDRPPGAN